MLKCHLLRIKGCKCCLETAGCCFWKLEQTGGSWTSGPFCPVFCSLRLQLFGLLWLIARSDFGTDPQLWGYKL